MRFLSIQFTHLNNNLYLIIESSFHDTGYSLDVVSGQKKIKSVAKFVC